MKTLKEEIQELLREPLFGGQSERLQRMLERVEALEAGQVPQITARRAVEFMIRECYETAKSKGWWDGDRNAPERVPELLCLIHSEVSEALECYRNKEAFLHFDITKTGNYPKPEGIASELADVLIRCFDMAGGMGIPLAEALKMKMEYNTGAPLQARRQGVLGL